MVCENKTETDKVLDFIFETKEGKYTSEKPDLTHIDYARMDIQEGNAANIFNECFNEIILYGIS